MQAKSNRKLSRLAIIGLVMGIFSFFMSPHFYGLLTLIAARIMNDSRTAHNLIWNDFYYGHILLGGYIAGFNVLVYILISLTGLILAIIALAKKGKPIAIPIIALVLGLYGVVEQFFALVIAIMP